MADLNRCDTDVLITQQTGLAAGIQRFIEREHPIRVGHAGQFRRGLVEAE